MGDGIQTTFKELIEAGHLELGDGYRTKRAEHGRPGLPILRVAEVLDGRIDPKFEDFVSDRYRRLMGNKISRPGDIVLTTKGTVGRVAMMPSEGPEFVYSPQVCYFRTTAASPLIRQYLYYWFRGEQFWSQARSLKGQTDMADYINLADLKSLRITLQSKTTQQAIATLLGALDDKIAVNNQIILKIDQLGEAVFCASFKSALEHVIRGTSLPPGWRSFKFGEKVSVLEAGRRPRGGVHAYRSGVPSIGAESITRLAQFDFTKVKYVPEDFYSSMRQGILRSHDILLYKDGGRPGNFEPHVTLFGDDYPYSRACINEHVFRIRMSPPLSQEFGYFWLASNPIMSEMRSRGTGVAVPGINSSAVKDLPIVEPPASCLDHFETLISPLISAALNSAKEVRALAELRDTLLPKLMSGQVQVREAERLVEDAT